MQPILITVPRPKLNKNPLLPSCRTDATSGMLEPLSAAFLFPFISPHKLHELAPPERLEYYFVEDSQIYKGILQSHTFLFFLSFFLYIVVYCLVYMHQTSSLALAKSSTD